MDDWLKIPLQDAMEWDLKILPFQTDRNDWAVWINPDVKRWLFIEHTLIAAVHEATKSDNYHDTFMGIGHKILKHLLLHGDPEPKMVQVSQFSGCPVDVRFAKYEGRIFVFSPRYEYECVKSKKPNVH